MARKKKVEVIKLAPCTHKICLVEDLKHIASTNSLFRPLKRGKRRFRPDADVMQFKDAVRSQLELVLKKIPNPDKKIRLVLGLRVYIKKSSFNRRDLSNCLKITEDVISQVVAIDDRYVLKVFIEKRRAESELESIEVFLGIHSDETCFNGEKACKITKQFLNWIN